MKNILRVSLLTITTIFVISFSLSFSAGATTSISKGYSSADNEIKAGMAVALSSDSDEQTQSVVRASIENKDKYIGIATRIDDSTVTITDSKAEIFVSDGGQSEVFVSDLNGEIKKGDVLVLSPLKGILMRKSDDGKNDTTVAIALGDLSDSDASSQEVDLKDGNKKQVFISKLEAEINTSTIIQEDQKKFFSVFGESLTGKPVSELRVLIACIILLLVLIIEGSLLYGAVSSSITAVGRNPLSRKAIYKQLVFTSFMGLTILLVGLGGIYVVIWT